jgi:nucleotide-binding universal stress UspA family protein
MVLICYDGSDDAKAAIEQAGRLFNASPALVLAVWEPFGELIARTSAGFGAVGVTDYESIDQASRDSARETAEQGAKLAREAGLDASAATRARDGTIARSILEEADRIDAGAIVLGSRGLTGVGSLLIGSVSHAVIQSADRAVLVVPSPTVAGRRADKLHAHEERT